MSTGRPIPSAHSARHESSRRFDAELHASAATEDAHIDLAAARRLAPELEEHDGRALDVLTAAAETSVTWWSAAGACEACVRSAATASGSRTARAPVLVVRTRAAQAA